MNLQRIKYLSIISLGLIGCGGGSNGSASNNPSEPVNAAPTADFSFDCTGLECRFESTSSDSDGQVESIEWDFGNDQESTFNSDTVLYDEFVDYSVSLTVIDNDGESSSLTKTVTPSKKVELNANIDWEGYSSELDKYSSYYGSLPVSLNSRKTWFSTLQIPQSHFTSSEVTFTSEEKPQHGVGYGTWANIGENHQLVFYANWVPGEPNAGSAMVLEYEDGEPVSLEVKSIEGSTSPSVMRNSDGSRQVIFPGVDEGKISIDAGAAAPSYTYNLETRSWKDIGVTLGAHNSIVFDYQRDGDDDLLAQNWLYGDFGENPAIWYLISQSQDRKLVENVFFAALTESHVSLDTSEHRARHRGRLPLTHLGVDNHRWAARLRMFVDESYERCCLTAPGYVWQEHEQAVRKYYQQAHARLKQSLASGFFN